MANITISPRASVDTNTAMVAVQVSGNVAGEDIAAGQPVYIKVSDNKLYKYVTGQVFAGIAARTVKAGQALTVFSVGTRFHASDTALTATTYFVGTAGTISDTATVDDARGAFIRVSPNDLMVVAAGKLA